MNARAVVYVRTLGAWCKGYKSSRDSEHSARLIVQYATSENSYFVVVVHIISSSALSHVEAICVNFVSLIMSTHNNRQAMHQC